MFLSVNDSDRYYLLGLALKAFALNLPNDLGIEGEVPDNPTGDLRLWRYIANNPDIVNDSL